MFGVLIVDLSPNFPLFSLITDVDGGQAPPADDAALRTLINEINAKLTSSGIDQRLNFVQFEWDRPLGEFLVLCNTFAAHG